MDSVKSPANFDSQPLNYSPTLRLMVEYERTQEREPSAAQPHKICVVGIGGGGLNVLDRIYLDRIMEATLVAMHTDVRVLSHSMGPIKIQLGADMMRGIGCGGDPELGREAAEATREQIKSALQGHEMVFICAGLGGGTGSGAAPVVAEIAKELGALVFVFATTPFSFEGRRRLTQAEIALETLQPYADAMILFENNRMGELILPKEGIQKAFSQADQLIGHSVRAISTMVNQPGIVRVSLADLTTALRSPNSRCLFGFGEARGASRVSESLKRALKSPLVNQGLLLQNAQNLIVHIAGGESITLAEIDQLMKQLGKHVPEETQIMFGVTVEPKLGDLLTVTLMSSLSARDMALEGAGRVSDQERIPTRPSDPARPIAKPPVSKAVAAKAAAAETVKMTPPAQPVNGNHGALTLTGFQDQPELPTLDSAKAAAPVFDKKVDLQIEELFAPAPPVEPPTAEVSTTPSSVDIWFSSEEAEHAIAPAPAAVPAPAPVVRQQPVPAPRPVEVPAAQVMPPQVPVVEEPRAEVPQVPVAPVPVKPVPVPVQPAAIVKTSIFSVVDEEEEEEEVEEEGPNWAEKYMQPKAQPAVPQMERREAEPVMAAAAPAPAVTPKAPVAAPKQPSLNLHQDDVGRFKGTDKIISEGEDLDVPTWMRMRGKIGK